MDLDNQEPTSNEVAAAPRKRGSRRVVSTDAPVESAPAVETPAEGAAEAAPERPRRRRPQADEAAPARDESATESSDEGSDNGDDNGFNRGRGRGRGRDRRRGRGSFGEDGDPEISDDDVLIPIGGILDVLDNYAFVRTQGYLPGSTDVYVSLGQVKKYNLRKGDAVIGAIRQPRDGENQGRQKYNALVSVDSVNGQTIDEAASRVDFQALTAVYPTERLRMETSAENITGRVLDIVTPVGKGQRGVIVGAPKTGKSMILSAMATAVAENARAVDPERAGVDGRAAGVGVGAGEREQARAALRDATEAIARVRRRDGSAHEKVDPGRRQALGDVECQPVARTVEPQRQA